MVLGHPVDHVPDMILSAMHATRTVALASMHAICYLGTLYGFLRLPKLAAVRKGCCRPSPAYLVSQSPFGERPL